MRKILLLIVLAVSFYDISAQWFIGGSGTVTLSNYKTKTPWNEVSNAGFGFGLAAYKQTGTHWGLHLGFEYLQKGYTHKICNTISDRLEATYVEIPIRVDYAFIIPSARNPKGHINVGLYGAYWVSGKYKMEGFDSSSEDFDFSKRGTQRIDVGPTAGTRLEYLLKNGSLSLDFRYETGLTDLEKSINDNTRNTNRAVIFGVSYLRLLN